MDQLKAQADIKIYYGASDEEIESMGGVTEVESTEDIEEDNEEQKFTFEETGNLICEEDGKPIVRMFSTTSCPHCEWVEGAFDSVAAEYVDKGLIKACHWQRDSGDNTLTEEVESKIPKEELEIFKKYNPKYTVPTFVFGCSYSRVGNAYEGADDLESEYDPNALPGLTSPIVLQRHSH